MRVEVEPRRADIKPYEPVTITVTITNTETIIGGYTVRLLGADPSWVVMPDEQISLFPDEVRIVTIVLRPPAGLAAGARRIAVQVRELTPPTESSITDIDLVVPEAKAISLRVDPLAVNAGKKASFSVIAENNGNSIVHGRLDGDDPESKVNFEFEPAMVRLAPGEHCVVDMRAKAKRPLMGPPVIRPLGLYLDEVNDDTFFSNPDDARDAPKGPRGDDYQLANATFIQKTKLSRGALSLIGLLIAVSVFAIVITVALGRLVGQTSADRDLALQVAAARDNGSGSGGSSGLAGTVVQLTNGKPLSAVSVSVYDSTDTTKPLATTATDGSGSYAFNQLAAGKYKLSYQRAGFVQIWYPAATADADATTVQIKPKQHQHGLDVTMGGVPASITGTVQGADVSAATLYLETVPGSTHTNSHTASHATKRLSSTSTTPPPTLPDNTTEAVVQKVAVGSDGTFSLSNVPSPSTYQLVVVKTGYATTTQELDVGAGEQRTGVSLTLRKGDGLIKGTVSGGSGPLGGVTISATSGQNTATTVSLKNGAGKGTFVLRSLPTPGDFTITASAPGFASQTLTVSLASAQSLKGVSITLTNSSGSVHGDVLSAADNSPESGVTVTASNGLLTVQTQSESGNSAGQWSIAGLPVPGTYTLTFTRADLASQTVAVSLDANGTVTGSNVQNKRVEVYLASSTAAVYGQISQSGQPLGEATVTLASGTSTYTVTSASVADPGTNSSVGTFRLEQIPPGVYTLTVSGSGGTSTRSRVITLIAGAAKQENVTLRSAASVTGTLVDANGKPLHKWTVFLYPAASYPTDFSAETLTSTTGAFSFANVDAGRYVIAFGPTTDPGAAVQTDSFTVLPGQPTPRGTITVRP
jgi:hypothetical protein